MEVFKKAALMAFGFLLLAGMVFADYQADLAQECQQKNTNGRQIWNFTVTVGQPDPGRGGTVITDVISSFYDEEEEKLIATYGNCVQVDCLQEPFQTDSAPLYCENSLLKSKNYAVSYVFPACTPIYTENYSYASDLICATCPSAKILSPYVSAGCSNGQQLLKRTVESYYDSSCTPRTINEYQVTGQPCNAASGLAGAGNILILIFVVVIIGIVLKKKGRI